MENIDDIFNIITGKILKKHRLEKKYSLEEVAKKMKTDITRQSLFKYENGKARIKVSTFIDICYALNLEPENVYKEINEQSFIISTNIKNSKNFEKTMKEYLNKKNE